MELFGIKFIGINVQNGHKLLLTIAFVVGLLLLGLVLKKLAGAVLAGSHRERIRFWTRQVIGLFTAILVIISVISIWVDNPAKLTTALGLVSAGLAFALQKVITSIAGYFVILRGKNFTVGDRISMGGVRGDVIGLGFIQTTIMEMGQPPAVQSADPAMWIKSRQFTGRIVSVANNKIFDDPIFNYTRNFPFIWEEIVIPISYTDDRVKAEQIMLEATRTHTLKISEVGAEAVKRLENEYYVEISDFEPQVFYRITDNWLELTVRFIVSDHKVRQIKNAISREMLSALEAAGIGIASATYDIVGFPPVRVVSDKDQAGSPSSH